MAASSLKDDMLLQLLVLVGIYVKGTEFVITFPDAKQSPDSDFTFTKRIYVSLDTANGHDQDTTVVLYMKDPDEQISTSLTKTNPVAVLEPTEIRQFPAGNTKGQRYLMRLEASSPVNVVVRNGGRSNYDTYLAIPTALLGLSYLAFTYLQVYDNHPASFVVIATLSETANVKLKLPESYVNEIVAIVDDVIYNNNDVIEFTLSPYEAYQIHFPCVDITGTFIESDEAIAVWSGTNRTSTTNTSLSHVIEQVPPSTTAGKEFALFPLVYDSARVPINLDIYRLVNVHLNTDVTLYRAGHARESYFLSNPGTVLEWKLGFDTAVSYVNSSKPVIVYWISPSANRYDPIAPHSGDVATMWLPPLDVSMPTRYTIQLMAGDASKWQYISFIIKKISMNRLTLNGNDLNSLIDFDLATFDISGRPDLIAGSLGFLGMETVPDAHELRQEDGVEFVAMLDGKPGWDAEGHPLSYGTAFSSENSETESDGPCCVTVSNDGIALYDNECSNEIAPYAATCCIIDHKATPCRRDKIAITTCSRSSTVVKRSSLDKMVSSKSTLDCHMTCFRTKGCLGINFETGSNAPLENCQLILGTPLGFDQEPSGNWRYVSCDQTIQYSFV